MSQEFKLFKVTVTDTVHGSSTAMEVRALNFWNAEWFVRSLYVLTTKDFSFSISVEEVIKSEDLFLE